MIDEARDAYLIKTKTDTMHRGGLLWDTIKPYAFQVFGILELPFSLYFKKEFPDLGKIFTIYTEGALMKPQK